MAEINRNRLLNGLKKFYGYSEFRPGQDDIIFSILQGRDTFVVMPTGGGKSLCYQLPALALKGTAIVISPLIALMKDQVDSLDRVGIKSTYINSTLPIDEVTNRLENMRQGNYKIVYIAPERLESRRFLEYYETADISFIAVDEAHCIAQWGFDFRPAYLNILKSLNASKRLPVAAFTATATPDVRLEIINILEMKDVNVFVKGFDRPNLFYSTINTSDKESNIIKYIKKCDSTSTIIYCGTRKSTEKTAEYLQKNGLRASAYHAGLQGHLRKRIQEDFVNDKVKIIAATNAFGMGIDKSDVRQVLHTFIPSSLEAYYQEAGRAGRDGQESECILLYQWRDRDLQEYFIENSYPDKNEVKALYDTLYDINDTAIGCRSDNAIVLDDVQIAERASLTEGKVTSIINVLERNGIARRIQSISQAEYRFLVSQKELERVFHNLKDEKALVLDALLRYSTGNNYSDKIRINPNDFILKHELTYDVFHQAIKSFVMIGIMHFISSGAPRGIELLTERIKFKNVSIDFQELEKRKEIAYNKLDIMCDYISTPKCKRNFILSYFEEREIDEKCGNCSSCQSDNKEAKNMKAVNKKYNNTNYNNEILDAIDLLDGRFGKTTVIDFLVGNKTPMISKHDLSHESIFGKLANVTNNEVRFQIEYLIRQGYAIIIGNEYPKIHITEKGRKYFKDNIESNNDKIPHKMETYDTNLFTQLSNLRQILSKNEGIRPNAIASTTLLKLIATYKPKNIEEMKKILGTGEIFINRYAEYFIDVINDIQHSVKKKNIKVNKISTSFEQKLLNELINHSDIDSISKRINTTKGSIARTLENGINSGDLKAEKNIVENSIAEKINRLLKGNSRIRLNQLRDKLSIDIDIALLRIAMAIEKKRISSL